MASRAIAIALSPRCGVTCGSLSALGVVVCGVVARLFAREYPHLGNEWRGEGMTHAKASSACAGAAAAYGVFLGLSLMNLWMNKARGRT
ncbi:unnamed product [Ostreococcus tauri]|jgi:hypothetical protein|uniref:Unnamed product n=1 Tax=Ostreococcus tauri TaxID=70448 RepID=A0A090M3N3_OSTTA|nr:unnamed product [Ostreococcus tauri]CEF98840.1 unnamed product [Ostreococcus tauri]|eukprot:XP_022839500.1 unnamed product [Ostreococcus tauri]